MSSGCFPSARRSLRQQRGDVHEIVREHGRGDQQFEALVALGKAALHATTSEQNRDASLDAGAKALACLELRTPFICFTFRRFLAAALRNAHHRDALLDATFFSLKKPRSDPYNSGARPKVSLWRSSD